MKKQPKSVRSHTPKAKENKHQQAHKSATQPEKGILKKKTKYLPLSNEAPIQVKQEISLINQAPLIKQTPQPHVSPEKRDHHIAEPHQPVSQIHLLNQPMLRLSQLTGYTPSLYNPNVVWLEEGYICYPCGTTLVIMNTDTREQKYCHATLPIAAIARYQKRIVAICENRSFYNYEKVHYQHVKPAPEHQNLQADSKQPAEISVWDYQTTQRVKHYQLPGYYGIVSLDTFVKNDVLHLLVCAMDHLQRQTLILIIRDQIALKHISQFHIAKARFGGDIVDFISVGKQNIRFWKAKLDSRTIQGHSPYLGEYARETNFTDYSVQGGRLLGSCSMGRLFGVSMETKEIVGVWQLGESRINAIAIDVSRNIVVTAHADGILKCWKNDFSEVALQVKCDTDVIGFDADGKGRILCAQQDRTIGVLNIKDRVYNYMVHSHRRGIIDIAYHAMLSRLVSVSEDQTIRVWVVQGTNIQQEYEFRCLDSMATVVHSQHTRNCALVGFDNGVLRIFDLKALVLKRELTLEIGAISAIASTSVDNLLLVSGVKETLCLNGQMDIIKTHPHKHYVSEKCQPVVQFNYDDSLYLLAFLNSMAGHVQIYSTDTLSELCTITLKQTLTSVNFESKWNDLLVGVSHDSTAGRSCSLRRYRIMRGNASFLQEVSLQDVNLFSAIPVNHAYVFTVNAHALNVWDYGFRGDDNGNPERQVYESQHQIAKVILANETAFSFATETGFLMAWQVLSSLTTAQPNQYDPTMQHMMIQRDKVWCGEHGEIEEIRPQPTNPRKVSPAKPRKLSPTIPKAPTQSKSPKVIKDIYQPVLDIIPKDMPQIQPSTKEGKVVNQPQVDQPVGFDHISLQQVFGHTFPIKANAQTIPWVAEHRYFVTAADKYLSVHTFTEHGMKSKLIEQPGVLQCMGICGPAVYASLHNQLRLYDAASQLLIKSIPLQCTELLTMSTSLCHNYALLVVAQGGITTPHLQIMELSSGRIMTSSILQGTSIRQAITVAFVGGHYDLQFIVMTAALTQLWRVSARGQLEYLDLDCKRQGEVRSACTLCHDGQTMLVIAQGNDLILYDLRQAKLIVEVKKYHSKCIASYTQQPILQVLASETHLMTLTTSPNVYFQRLHGPLKEIFESKPQILSLDGSPVACSQLNKHELIVACKTGQVWFIDLEGQVTLKLQQGVSQHCRVTAAQYLEGPKLLVCGSSDGTVRVIESATQETQVDFIVPKRACLCLAVFDARNIIAAGFDDCLVRFFNLNDHSLLGTSQLNTAVTHLTVLPKLLVALCGTLSGDVHLLHLKQSAPNSAFELVIQAIQTEIGGVPLCTIRLSLFDQQNVWAASTVNGKVQVYERKKIVDEELILDKNKLTQRPPWFQENVVYYLADQYRTKLNVEVQAIFSAWHHDQILIGLSGQIIVRNFREHLDLQVIDLSRKLIGLSIANGFIAVLSQDCFLSVYDHDTLIEVDRKQVFESGKTSPSFQAGVVCLDNLMMLWNVK